MLYVFFPPKITAVLDENESNVGKVSLFKPYKLLFFFYTVVEMFIIRYKPENRPVP